MPGRFFSVRTLQWTHSIVACSDFTAEFLAEFLGVQAAFEVALRDLGLDVPTLLEDTRIDPDIDICKGEGAQVESAQVSPAPSAGAGSDMAYNRSIEPRLVLQTTPGVAVTSALSPSRMMQENVLRGDDVQTCSRCTVLERSFPGRSNLRNPDVTGNRLETSSRRPKSVSFSFEVQFWFPGPNQICLSSASKARAHDNLPHRLAPFTGSDCNGLSHVGLRLSASAVAHDTSAGACSDTKPDRQKDTYQGSEHACTSNDACAVTSDGSPCPDISSLSALCYGLSHVGLRLPCDPHAVDLDTAFSTDGKPYAARTAAEHVPPSACLAHATPHADHLWEQDIFEDPVQDAVIAPDPIFTSVLQDVTNLAVGVFGPPEDIVDLPGPKPHAKSRAHSYPDIHLVGTRGPPISGFRACPEPTERTTIPEQEATQVATALDVGLLDPYSSFDSVRGERVLNGSRVD